MQTETIHSSDRSTVELVCGEKKFIRRTVYSECAVYNVLKDVSSDFLPKIYSEEITNGKTVICEEYIDGKRLTDVDLSEKQAEKIMLQLCSALEFIHKLGIVHRDIKPSNILLCESGSIKLIDFETARFIKENSEKDTRCLGTEGFAPPEQYGFAQTDCRTDIYAAGQTMKIILGSLSAKSAYKKIIRRCISFDPDKRYQSALELKNALRRLHRTPFYITVSALFSAAAVLALTFSFLTRKNTVFDEPANVETETSSVQTEEAKTEITTITEETTITKGTTITEETTITKGTTKTEEETISKRSESRKNKMDNSDESTREPPPYYYDGNGTLYLTDFNEEYRKIPEYVPEYDNDDKIFFCEDSNARIFLANGKKLFKDFEKYTMYTDIDKSGRDECITIEVNPYNELEIYIGTPKVYDAVQYAMELCGSTLQTAILDCDIGEKTIVQITCFELDGDNLLALTIGDKTNYNYTGFFTVKDDEPYFIGRTWGETYARVYGNSIDEYFAAGNANIYSYTNGKLSAINTVDGYNGSDWPNYYDLEAEEWVYDYTVSE